MSRWFKRTLWFCAIIVGVLLTVRFVATPYVVVGDSMAPTLKSWDLCVMVRVRSYQPRRGDIVMFRTADEPRLYFIKRVVALPGETVAVQRGQITVDRKPVAEPYSRPNGEWEMPATAVPANKVFVLGDNREGPLAGYVYGLVATRLVQARLQWHWRWKS